MTELEFWKFSIAVALHLIILFYTVVGVWVIRRFDTSEELREWAKKWRDK